MSNLTLTPNIYDKLNFGFPGQNGICDKKYYFWPKNDDEKWSRKNYFEIPPCAGHFLLNEFTS